MNDELTNRKGPALKLFLAGGVLGAGVALILAPKSGSDTRKYLKRLAERFSQTIDIGKDLYGESRKFVSKAVEAGKKAYVDEKPLDPIGNGRRSLLVPVLASGVIGAGLALLLAPKSGSDTRKDLKRYASATRDNVASAIDKGRDLYETGKSAITGVEKIPYVEGKREVLNVV